MHNAWLYLVICLLMIIVISSDPPSVSASGPSKAVNGYSITLSCNLTGGYPTQLTEVTWMKGDDPL